MSLSSTDKLPAPTQREWILASLGLLLLTLLLGAYAIKLNHLFYQKFGPFFDSMSYLAKLADTIDRTNRDGWINAVKFTTSGSTVFLPFGLVPLFGAFVTPSREIAIWLQCLWVYGLNLSLLYYFVRCKQASLLTGSVLSALFVTVHAVFFWNGGLSDFRIDLQLYLLFGVAMTWLLVALHTQTTWAWGFFGAACGLCSLGRATAPVFITLTALPLVLPSLVSGREKFRQTIRGVAMAAGICTALSAWFFVLNWKQLHYYYFIWNLDANARLPLKTSIKHFEFAANSLGPTIALTAAACVIILLCGRFVHALRARRLRPEIWIWLREIEWRALPLALMPAGYLAASGAGLNPFVSMPSTFGMVLGLLALGGSWRASRLISMLIAVTASIGMALSASTGVPLHRQGPGDHNWIAAYAEVARVIEDYAKNNPKREVRVSQFSLGYYHNYALASYLIYDRKLSRERDRFILGESELILTGAHLFAPATKVEWDAIPGNDDDAKTQHIIGKLDRDVDLVILPSEQTARQLASDTSYNYINRHTPRLRQELLATGRWVEISPQFRASTWESYSVYRNSAR